MKSRRQIFNYGNHFQEFYKSLEPTVKKKVDWVIGLVRDLEVIPSKFFKHIRGSDGIYEIRIMVHRNIYRIFCFFDEGKLIILLHGFQKKTRKTPKNEIIKAEK
ncbi:MAG: type II toxin-antitoxin system RelE/ParE family toxin [Bacteroidales bacterium]|nr:type II toxin-antitoxin system RelE/ParE family toxin [Bacteroidales bacterium]